MNKDDIIKFIKDEIKKAGGFVTKKINSAPLEAFDVVNKTYVDTLTTVAKGRSHGTGVQSLSNLTPTVLSLGANDYAVNVTWDATNNQFKATKSGYYQATAFIDIAQPSLNDFYQLEILHNGSLNTGSTYFSHLSSGTNVVTIMASEQFNCAVNDTIQPKMNLVSSDGLARNINGRWMFIQKIS